MAPPRTLWTRRDADGALITCVLVPAKKTAVVWHRDGEVQGVEEFRRQEEAEVRAAELRDEVFD
jgi:hypothetical protein